MSLTAVNDLTFPTKREVFDEIENRYHKVLTYSWIHEFLRRHQDDIAYATVGLKKKPVFRSRVNFSNSILLLSKNMLLGSTHNLFTILMTQDALIGKSERRIIG
jgi:hypothetical protein